MYNKFVKKLSKEQKEIFIKEYKILAINRHLKVIGIDKVAPKMKGIDFYNADMSNYTKLKKVYKKISRKYKNVKFLFIN